MTDDDREMRIAQDRVPAIQDDPDGTFREPWRYHDAYAGWTLQRWYPHYRAVGRVRNTEGSAPKLAAVWFDPGGTNMPPGRHRADLGVEVHIMAKDAAEGERWVRDIFTLGEQLSRAGMAAWLAAGKDGTHRSTEAVLREMVRTDTGEFGVQIVAASYAGERKIHLTLDNGVTKTVDVAGCLWGPAFATIASDDQAFAELYFDPAAGTVCWPGDLDLSPEALITLPDIGEPVTYDHLDDLVKWSSRTGEPVTDGDSIDIETADERLANLLNETLPRLLDVWGDFENAETIAEAAFAVTAVSNAVTSVRWDYRGFDEENPLPLTPTMFAADHATTTRRIAEAEAMEARVNEAEQLRRIRKTTVELLTDDE